MTNDSAQLKPVSTDSGSRGIHLVHSRSWQSKERRASVSAVEPSRTLAVRHIRESQGAATLSLGFAAVAAPLVWLGHAMMRWFHLI